MEASSQPHTSSLSRELQQLEGSLAERELALKEKQNQARLLNSKIVDANVVGHDNDASRRIAQKAFRDTSRIKQALENGKGRYLENNTEGIMTSEGCEAQWKESNGTLDHFEGEAKKLSTCIEEIRKKKDTQKRLTVVRVISMLDDLHSSLESKVHGPGETEDVRAQELLKDIQEMSRARERNLVFLRKKEREMTTLIELKKHRIQELRNESQRNVSSFGDSNNEELRNVVDRIQIERSQLIREIERLEEANERMAEVMLDTKFTSESAMKDRDSALSADAAMCTSADPEKESKELRERIVKANAERHMYMKKSEELQFKIDDDTQRYNAKMSKLKKEILFYQSESSRFEKEINVLKRFFDSLAGSL